MQLLHFSFGIGAFLAPLLARPFLLGDAPLGSNNSLYPQSHHPINTKFLPLSSTSDSQRNVHKLVLDSDWLSGDFRNLRLERAAENLTEAVSERVFFPNLNLTESPNRTQNENSFAFSAVTTPIRTRNETNVTMSVGMTLPSSLRPHKPEIVDGFNLNQKYASSDIIKGTLLQNKDKVGGKEDIKSDGEKERYTTTLDTTPQMNDNTSLGSNYPNLTHSHNFEIDRNVSFNLNTSSSNNGHIDDFLSNNKSSESIKKKVTEVISGVGILENVSSTATPTALTSQMNTSSQSTLPSTTTTSTIITTTTFDTTTIAKKIMTAIKLVTTTISEMRKLDGGNITNNKFPENISHPNGPFENMTTTTQHTSPTQQHKPLVLTDMLNTAFDAMKNMSKIQFAYLIIGLLLLANATFFCVLYCRDCCAGNMLHQVSSRIPSSHIDSCCFRLSFLILLFVFFFIYVGMEVTFGGLLTTFAVEFLKWNQPQGATLAALFWGSIAVGRGLAIFVARFFKPPCMIVMDLVLVLTGTIMLSFTIQATTIMPWIGTLTLGLGMSSIFPSAVSWADNYYPLTGRAAAVFIAGSGIGEMTVPVMTSYLFENISSMWLMYMMFILSIILCVVYIILQCIATRRLPHPTSSKVAFMPLQNDDEDEKSTDSFSRAIVNGSSGYLEMAFRRRPATVNHVRDSEEMIKLVDSSE